LNQIDLHAHTITLSICDKIVKGRKSGEIKERECV